MNTRLHSLLAVLTLMLDCDAVCGGGGGLGSCIGTPISDIKSVMRFDLILKSKGLSLSTCT